MKLEISDVEILEPIVRRQEQIDSKIDPLISLINNFMLVSGQKSIWKISDIQRLQARATTLFALPRAVSFLVSGSQHSQQVLQDSRWRNAWFRYRNRMRRHQMIQTRKRRKSLEPQ